MSLVFSREQNPIFHEGKLLAFTRLEFCGIGIMVTLLKVPDEWVHKGTHTDTREIHYQSGKSV